MRKNSLLNNTAVLQNLFVLPVTATVISKTLIHMKGNSFT